MRTVRLLTVAAMTAATMTAGTPPASALADGVFHGTVWVDCFGCGGYSSGSADLSVTGVVNNVIVTGAPATANFGATVPPGVTCVVNGFAGGDVVVETVVGPQASGFYWTRLGSVAVVSLPDFRANGVAALVLHVTGIPCGTENLTADVAGVFWGV